MNISRYPKDVATLHCLNTWIAQSGTRWPMLTIPIDRIDEYFEKIVLWNLREWEDWVMLDGSGPFGSLTHRRLWLRDPQAHLMLKLSIGDYA